MGQKRYLNGEKAESAKEEKNGNKAKY